MNKNNIFVHIGARGNLQGLKNKNIRNFLGKPLISRTALQAKSLKKKFPKAVIGLSGYIIDNFSSYAALGLRTSIIEKHFIDTKKRNRPDVPASKDESEFKNLLKASDTIFQNLKDKKSKKPLREEKLTMKFAFASVVSIKNIKKGKKFKKKYLG